MSISKYIVSPDMCRYTFVFPYRLDGLNIEAVRQRLNQETSGYYINKQEDRFEPYVPIYEDDLFFFSADPNKNMIITYDDVSMPCEISIMHHIEQSGICSILIDIKIFWEAISSEPNMIKISNLFEDKKWFVLMPERIHPIKLYYNEIESIKKCFNTDCYDNELRAFNEMDDSTAKILPFVMTFLYYKDSKEYRNQILQSFENPFDSDETDLESLKCLIALLYRFKTPDYWPEVDLSYAKAITSIRGGVIENHHPHQGIYITLHMRSILVAIDESEEEKIPSEYFMALKETISDSYAKWMYLMDLNSSLDKYLHKIKKDKKPEDIIKKILLFRRAFASLLDTSIEYKHASGSLSEINRRFIEIFNIRQLIHDGAMKIDIMEKIFDNVQQLRFFDAKL